MDNDKIGKTDNCFQKMDQLDKLSLKELIDLNAAVQSEITRRLLNLGEENRRCRSRLVDDDVRSEEGFDDDSRESRRFRLQRSSDKNSGWINTGKLKATVRLARDCDE